MVGTTLRWAFGLSALALFLAMAAILYGSIAPVDPLLPQTKPWGYSYEALERFGLALHNNDLVGIYRICLIYLDSAFIILFAAWVFVWFYGRLSVFATLAFAGAIICVDFTENTMLIAQLGLDSGTPNVDTNGISIHQITAVKYVIYLIVMLVVLNFFVSDRRK